MNKAQLDGLFNYTRQVFGNARRQVELIPEDKLDFRPTPEVRTVKELVMHMHEYVTVATDSVAKGKFAEVPLPEIKTKAELMKWMDAQVAKGFATFATLTDAQIAATINAWGMDFPAWQMLSAVHDELLHHRGQLTVYLRLIGKAPVSIYDLQ